jgi:hypothetical protein
MPAKAKAYLGDGAYVEWDDDDDGGIILTTENGISVGNRIVLGGRELLRLLDYLEAIRKEEMGE